MNKVFSNVACSLLVLALFSCAKQESENVSFGPGQSILAVYTDINEPETKNTISNLQWTVGWSEGDEIAVVNLGTGAIAKYTIQSSYVGKNYGIFDHTSGDAGDGSLVAVYPYSAASWEAGTLYVTLQKDVVYNASGSYAPAEKPSFSTNDIQISKPMTASALSNELHFNRVISLMTVYANFSKNDLRGQSVNNLVIQAPGIAGKAAVSFNGEGVPSITRSSGTLSEINCSLTSAPIISSANYIARFIPLLPYSTSSGLYYCFSTTDYELGVYRQRTWNSTINGNTNFFVYEAAGTQVKSKDYATIDMAWWYTSKDGGMNDSGSFGNTGDTQYGSTAGRFTE